MPGQMRSQPQGLLRINRGHPVASGLVDVWLPGVSTRGLLTGVDSSTVASGATSATPAGLGWRCASTSRRYSSTILNSQRVAWLVIAMRDGSGNVGQSVVRKDGTITPLQDFDGNVRTAYFDGSGNFVGTANYGNSSQFANKTSTFCGYIGPDKSVIWSNGGPDIGAPNNNATTGNRTNPFCIGGNESGGEIATAWNIIAVFAWQGPNTPSSDRLRAFSNNPWAIFDAGSNSSTYQSAIAASSGTAASPSVAASLNWTEGSDTAAVTAVETDPAVLAWTEGNDTQTVTAVETDRASVAWTEADDVQALAGIETNRAAVSWTEANDSAQLSGSVLPNASSGVSGAVTWTEANDTMVLAGQILDRSALAWTEQDDGQALKGYANTPPIVTASVRFSILPRALRTKTIHYSN